MLSRLLLLLKSTVTNMPDKESVCTQISSKFTTHKAYVHAHRLQNNLPTTEFYAITGYQPSELKVVPWKLFDEWGNDYDGILTYETEGAPRLMRIASRRTIKGAEFSL